MLLKIRSIDCTLIEVILQGKKSLYLEDDGILRKSQYAIMKKKS